MIQDRHRDAYKIQGEIQRDCNDAQFNTPGRGSFTPHGGFRGRGRNIGLGGGSGQIIYYNCGQVEYLTRDCQNPCTTCKYCKSFHHVIEACPILLAKIQEKRPPMHNKNIYSPKLTVVVHVLLSCMHQGFLWLDPKIDINT